MKVAHIVMKISGFLSIWNLSIAIIQNNDTWKYKYEYIRAPVIMRELQTHEYISENFYKLQLRDWH